MAFFTGRFLTVLAFLLVSAGVWFILDGFGYRMLFAAVPFLLAVQITLSDALEGILMAKLNYKTKWFTFLIAPGTILHELCHLFAVLATGATVTKAALFKPDPRTGVLGYVNYAQPRDRWLVFREFIIGFAPFFGCGLLLFMFNVLHGGDLLSLLDDSPVPDLESAGDSVIALVSAVSTSMSNINYSKPAMWVVLYLQFCFGLGAAPSSTDFKGTFSSLRKHLFSALFFTAFTVSAVLVSNQYFGLGGLEERLAYAVAVALKFIIVVLLLSIALLAVGIPLAYAGVLLLEIKGIAKTVPLTAAFLVFYAVQNPYGIRYAFSAAVLAFMILLLLFRYEHLFRAR